MRSKPVRCWTLAAVIVFAAGSPLAAAQQRDDPQQPTKPQAAAEVVSLDHVKWLGSPASLEGLRGKTVVVLVYATWCPKANVWSVDLLHQVKAAIEGKPVVVLAINADDKPVAINQYISARGFTGLNILHGYDPGMPKRLHFVDNLYHYLLIDPKGYIVERGQAGSYFTHGEEKEYVIAHSLKEQSDLGKFIVLTPRMSEQVKQIAWAMEMGNLGAYGQARRSLKSPERDELETAVGKYLDKQIAEIQKLAQGEAADKLRAYDKAAALAGTFKTTSQARKAKAISSELEQDPDFKKELKAKKAYDRSMKIAAANPGRRHGLLNIVATQFKGTHYGDLAQQIVDGNATESADKEK